MATLLGSGTRQPGTAGRGAVRRRSPERGPARVLTCESDCSARGSVGPKARSLRGVTMYTTPAATRPVRRYKRPRLGRYLRLSPSGWRARRGEGEAEGWPAPWLGRRRPEGDPTRASTSRAVGPAAGRNT